MKYATALAAAGLLALAASTPAASQSNLPLYPDAANPEQLGIKLNDTLWTIEWLKPQWSPSTPSTFTLHQEQQPGGDAMPNGSVATTFDANNHYVCEYGALLRPCKQYIKIVSVSPVPRSEITTTWATKQEATKFTGDVKALFAWSIRAEYTTNAQQHTGDVYCILNAAEYPGASIVNTEDFDKISGDISWVNEFSPNKFYQAPVVRLLFNHNHVPPNAAGQNHWTRAVSAYMVDENNIQGVYADSFGIMGGFSMQRQKEKPTVAANPQCP